MLTYVYSYYENPGMLARQYEEWAGYPEGLKSKIEIIVVDDASPNSPALEVPRPAGLPKLRIFRAKIDVPWHQDGARNLGAYMANDGWMFLCDMDHIMPAASLQLFLEETAKHTGPTIFRTYFKFGRKELDGSWTVSNGHRKIGTNILGIHRRLYWNVGGYDEDMCGFYGSDGLFLKRLNGHAQMTLLEDAAVIRVTRTAVPDCSTRLPRKGPENEAIRKRLVQMKKTRRRPAIVTLDFEWERVL